MKKNRLKSDGFKGKRLNIRGKKFLIVFLLSVVIVATYVLVIRPYLMSTMGTVVFELMVAGILSIGFVISLITILITLIITIGVALYKRKKDCLMPWLVRMKNQSIIIGVLIVVITFVTIASQWLAYTPPILGEDGKIIDGSVAELKKVNLNGSDQWITIRGKSTNNPVLLFLSGGPGGTQLAATRTELKQLEDHFVVVNWEQPGSGKSFNAVATNSITPEKYISDAYKLTQYLCGKFNRDKIYVVGESWGSALGVLLVERYPEYFHAFVGTGQMVSFVETELHCYEFALDLANESGDTKLVNKLLKQGQPPYYGKDVTWKSANYLMYLSNYMAKNPDIKNATQNTLEYIAGPEYGLYDKVNFFRGLVTTFNHVYPQLYDIDLRKQSVKIDVPVYFFEGRHDVNAPTAFAEEYYEVLKAPSKEMVWFEQSGHSPWINESEKFVDGMVNLVLKETN